MICVARAAMGVAMLLALSLLFADSAAGQPGDVVNPRAIEFDVVADGALAAVMYRVEIFRAGVNPGAAAPVRTVDVAASDVRGGSLRVDLTAPLEGLADGRYIATVRAVGVGAQSDRSAPVGPFSISGRASSGAGGTTSDSAPAASAGSPPDDGPDRLRWTVIGIGMGLAALLIPLFAR